MELPTVGAHNYILLTLFKMVLAKSGFVDYCTSVTGFLCCKCSMLTIFIVLLDKFLLWIQKITTWAWSRAEATAKLYFLNTFQMKQVKKYNGYIV